MVRLPQISAPSIIEPVWDCMERQKQPRQTSSTEGLQQASWDIEFGSFFTAQRTMTEQLFYLLSFFASSRLIFFMYLLIHHFNKFWLQTLSFHSWKTKHFAQKLRQVFQLKVLTIWPAPVSNLFKWWWLCWVVRRHQGTHWHTAVGTAETNLW